MGKRDDGKPITSWARSWAQFESAKTRPEYNLIRQSHNGVVRWKLERVHGDRTIVAIGDYGSRPTGVTAGKILAGHTGRLTVKSTEG